MITCQICGKECKGLQALSNHLGLTHKINTKELKQQYYDTYIKQKDEGYCLCCGKPTHFQSLDRGYTQHCCKSCQVRMQGNGAKIDHNEMWEIRRKRIQQYEIEHHCTHIKTIQNIYGIHRTYDAIELFNIPIIKVSRMYQYIQNEYIDKIKYFSQHYDRTGGTSGKEKYLRTHIQCENQIIANTKSIIYPKELDIYIPKLKLAIEYNGIYFHSVLHGMSKEYHLEKSLLCREKRIRLIHIYEFEDLEHQIYLLNQLILGDDLYNPNDFNKNNLIDIIPNPQVIYDDGRCIIYGAGKLY